MRLIITLCVEFALASSYDGCADTRNTKQTDTHFHGFRFMPLISFHAFAILMQSLLVTALPLLSHAVASYVTLTVYLCYVHLIAYILCLFISVLTCVILWCVYTVSLAEKDKSAKGQRSVSKQLQTLSFGLRKASLLKVTVLCLNNCRHGLLG